MLPVIIAAAVLTPAFIAVGILAARRYRASHPRPEPPLEWRPGITTPVPFAIKAPAGEAAEPAPGVDEAAIVPTLDWYILRHIEDQQRMPVRQVFLDEDRRQNDLLNRYALQRMATDGIHFDPMDSTLRESVRPPDASHYIPRYFPDAELDSALVMYKHELIANRLVDTIAFIHRQRDGEARPLGSFADLSKGNTPFVPEAYVAFYNDILAAVTDFDGEEGMREKMRVMAVRAVFPARAPEVEFWRKRGFDVYELPVSAARHAVTDWFRLDPLDVPLAAPKGRK